MNSQKINDIYKKNITPKQFLGTFNAILAFAILIFILFTAFTRCKDGKFEANISLTVSPVPFEEATPAEIKKLLTDSTNLSGAEGNTENTGVNTASSQEMKSIPHAAANSSTSAANTNSSIQNQNSRRANAENLEWTKAFLKFAKKIQITDITNMHSFFFNIKRFPLNHQNPDYLQIDYEFYNDQMEYLFTFNADNYWEQSGYDDGAWHEFNYSEKLKVKFARAGTYYVIACIPRDRFSSVMYNIVKTHSNGSVECIIYSGIMSLSVFSVFSGFVFFLTTGIILLKKRKGDISKWEALYIANKINRFDYIIKLPDYYSKDPYYIKGIIKTPFKNMDTVELILEQNDRITYLEIERESGKNESKVYNYYYYDEFPSDLNKIPTEEKITYKNEYFKLSELKKEINYVSTYANGIKEEFTSIETVYYTSGWYKILVFESKKDSNQFETLLANKIINIKNIKIWKVPKIKETD